MSRQTYKVWGAALAALFSIGLGAQETIERGNERDPHQPPAWFVRLASEPVRRVEPEPFQPRERFRPLGGPSRPERTKTICPGLDAAAWGKGEVWC